MAERPPGRVLLDTHVWIWLLEAPDSHLAPGVREVVDQAAQSWAVRIAAMSVWEVGMLTAHRRLTLSLECAAWVHRALGRPGVRLEPLTPAIAIEATRLPGRFHRDPVDQILVATARLTGATLVTRDRRILDYAAKGYLRVLDATPADPR